MVILRLLWGPVPPVLASVLSVTVTWTFFAIGEILLLVNILRVFLVMLVMLLQIVYSFILLFFFQFYTI